MNRIEWESIKESILGIRTAASDEVALVNKYIYPLWRPDVTYTDVDRVRYGDSLYHVRMEHVSQAQYPPSINTAALYEEISLESGTMTHPIPYNNNMELVEGKYYTQDNVLYLCTRSTGVAVYNPLAQLVGLYVEVVE